MKLAYACSWWRPISTTWSGTSGSLMNALDERPDVDLVRVDGQHDAVTSAALAGLARAGGYGVWKFSRQARRMTDARLRRRLGKLDVDAVIDVGDIETVTRVPTFLYQDANFSTLKAHRDIAAEHAPAQVKFPAGRLDELIAEQRAAYASAAGVLSFSQWFARWLVEHDGVAPDRVHVVGGGLSGLPAKRDLRTRGAGGTSVLFIGRDFFRKGGELVVAAIDELRRSGAGDFTLTVIGPSRWPMPTPIPEWVDFRGEMAAAEVRRIWADHDIFAMPTWYEPYGLVFLEARAAGLPSLGRASFSMPELIPPTAGRLIPPLAGADAVAAELLAMSQDESLFVDADRDSEAVRKTGGWDGVAARAVSAISSVVN